MQWGMTKCYQNRIGSSNKRLLGLVMRYETNQELNTKLGDALIKMTDKGELHGIRK